MAMRSFVPFAISISVPEMELTHYKNPSNASGWPRSFDLSYGVVDRMDEVVVLLSSQGTGVERNVVI